MIIVKLNTTIFPPSQEIWLPVPGWETLYAISNCGRIQRLTGSNGTWAGRITCGSISRYGYPRITLSDAGSDRSQEIQIHILVAQAFIGPCPPDKDEVNHIDGIKIHNWSTNLEYATFQENIEHSVRQGLHASGEEHPIARLTEKDVEAIFRARGTVGARTIAQSYHVSHRIPILIWNRKIWRRVTLPLLAPDTTVIPGQYAISSVVQDLNCNIKRWTMYHIPRPSDPILTICGRSVSSLANKEHRFDAIVTVPADLRCARCYQDFADGKYSLEGMAVEQSHRYRRYQAPTYDSRRKGRRRR